MATGMLAIFFFLLIDGWIRLSWERSNRLPKPKEVARPVGRKKPLYEL